MDVKQRGGKSIIIVDEAQMLCEAHDVLQELRTLINLTHEGQYLHTFVLSSQRALEYYQRDAGILAAPPRSLLLHSVTC